MLRKNCHSGIAPPALKRRGAFMMLAFFCLIATLSFVAFSIDTGNIALNKTLMQNGVDAAALAAAMEITSAVENAPPGEEDPTAYAREQAKLKAVEVAGLNGVFVDPNIDVDFGLRSFNPETETFEIQWGVEPANAVKVTARRDNDDVTAPDGKLPMMFAGVIGEDKVRMQAEAIAYIESRDIAVVLDFSGSMAYDSTFIYDSVQKLGVDAIRDNLRQMYWELETSDGQLGRLDYTDPDSGGSGRDAEAKWLVVHGDPESESDPQIDVTFMYDQALVESDMPFHQVKLKFDGDWYTISDLEATSGTYRGYGDYWGDNIDAVKVYVETGGGPVVQSGEMGGGAGPTATVSVNHDDNSVTVELDSNSLDRIKVYYTDGSTDNWYDADGQHEVVYADNWKTIEDVKVYSSNGYDEKFYDFDDGASNEYIETLYDDNDAVREYFQLDGVSYPYESGSWNDYIDYVRSSSDIQRGGHRETYGGITFVHYLLQRRPAHDQTSALAKTSHFPFHAVRAGNELFVDFLDDLGFGDHVGLVSYDQERRTEMLLSEDGQSIDISDDPLEDNYDAIKTIMDYKQANHYYPYTNIGGGIREARKMIEDHGRQGARPTILLMTDGNANTYDNEAGDNSRDWGFSEDNFWDVPGDFDWSEFSELETEQESFYVSSSGSENKARRYALSQAFKAVEDGITVHTLAVGAGADRDLMKAIAHLGGGEYIEVRGELTVADLLTQVEGGFYRIAALVPPARLADPEEATP